jgi:hypothetical protein
MRAESALADGSAAGEAGRVSPAAEWDADVAQRALDELFTLSQQYRRSAAYFNLMKFISRFRWYAPFNAMLVHAQMPGARFVAPAGRWLHEYGRRVRVAARPLVILQPKGPVMFVFDVSDTEPVGDDSPPLPVEVTEPFEVQHGSVGLELERTVTNAVRDGILIAIEAGGSQSAGSIRTAGPGGGALQFQVRVRPQPAFESIPRRYELLLNKRHSREAQYATLVHELAHLYCGHLGSPDPRWWPDRRGFALDLMEFEAESVSYLVCTRLGIATPSAE